MCTKKKERMTSNISLQLCQDYVHSLNLEGAGKEINDQVAYKAF